MKQGWLGLIGAGFLIDRLIKIWVMGQGSYRLKWHGAGGRASIGW